MINAIAKSDLRIPGDTELQDVLYGTVAILVASYAALGTQRYFISKAFRQHSFPSQ